MARVGIRLERQNSSHTFDLFSRSLLTVGWKQYAQLRFALREEHGIDVNQGGEVLASVFELFGSGPVGAGLEAYLRARRTSARNGTASVEG